MKALNRHLAAALKSLEKAMWLVGHAAVTPFEVAITALIRLAQASVRAVKSAEKEAVVVEKKAVRGGKAAGRKAARGARAAETGFIHLLQKLALAPVHGVRRAARSFVSVGKAFADLFRQIGGDLKHLAIYLVHETVHLSAKLAKDGFKFLKVITVPLRRIFRPVTDPLARRFAKQAKDQALGTTPDQHAHWEWLALGAFVLVSGYILAALLGYVQLVPAQTESLQPHNIIVRISTYSPLQMTVLAGFVLFFLGLTVFWTYMLRDSYQRTFATQTEQVKWRLVTTLFFIPGAFYYFAKVYNQWGVRQFIGYHMLSVMITGVAVLVTASSGGLLYYFHQKANAAVSTDNLYHLPNLKIDDKTKRELLSHERYGSPLTPASGGRTDPFAPVPGQTTLTTTDATPTPSPSPTPAP